MKGICVLVVMLIVCNLSFAGDIPLKTGVDAVAADFSYGIYGDTFADAFQGRISFSNMRWGKIVMAGVTLYQLSFDSHQYLSSSFLLINLDIPLLLFRFPSKLNDPELFLLQGLVLKTTLSWLTIERTGPNLRIALSYCIPFFSITIGTDFFYGQSSKYSPNVFVGASVGLSAYFNGLFAP